MAMSASTRIYNNTGGIIKFVSISQVNDDATWDIQPSVGSVIQNSDSCLIAMGNSSCPPFVRGVGFNAKFVDSNLDLGGVYLDDPAIGAHSFNNTGDSFDFRVTNPSGNSYEVYITKK